MNPVVHSEIRSDNPDEARAFYGELFGWTFPEGGMPGYAYVDLGVPNTIPGGIGPTQGGNALTTFFVGVENVPDALAAAERLGGRVLQPATSVPAVTLGLFADPQGPVVGVAAAS